MLRRIAFLFYIPSLLLIPPMTLLFMCCFRSFLLAALSRNHISFVPLKQHINMFKLPAFWLEKHSEFLVGLSVGQMAEQLRLTSAQWWEEAQKNQHWFHHCLLSRTLSRRNPCVLSQVITRKSGTNVQVLNEMIPYPANAIPFTVHKQTN